MISGHSDRLANTLIRMLAGIVISTGALNAGNQAICQPRHKPSVQVTSRQHDRTPPGKHHGGRDGYV